MNQQTYLQQQKRWTGKKWGADVLLTGPDRKISIHECWHLGFQTKPGWRAEQRFESG